MGRISLVLGETGAATPAARHLRTARAPMRWNGLKIDSRTRLAHRRHRPEKHRSQNVVAQEHKARRWDARKLRYARSAVDAAAKGMSPRFTGLDPPRSNRRVPRCSRETSTDANAGSPVRGGGAPSFDPDSRCVMTVPFEFRSSLGQKFVVVISCQRILYQTFKWYAGDVPKTLLPTSLSEADHARAGGRRSPDNAERSVTADASSNGA